MIEPKSKKRDDEIVSLARTRLAAAMAALSESRGDELDDLRFAAGSPDNQWQWPNDVLGSRGVTSQGESLGARPCLTINKLPQHIKQVTNDQRTNRPAGKVIPADSHADVEVAEIFNGMVRHIEYNSDADVAYDTACENQVTFGEGYIRILTEYVDGESFDQEILIKRVRNSFSVYMDPMIQDPCGADARWCFISEDVPKEDYENQYPDAQPVTTLLSLGMGDQSVNQWLGDETIRIVEYFYYDTTTEVLNLYPGAQTAFDGTPEDKMLKMQYGAPVRTRRAEKKQVKWCKTNGYEILEKSDWPGKCIPVVRVIGNEFEVDGRLYVSGIVRNAKDAQRMYNYWASQEAEMLALAPKAPFIGYGGQFEGYENQWKTANTKNWPYLEVNPEVTDGNGGVLPLPQRAQPPMAQHGLIAAKQGASEDIKETTGQYNASLGMTSNERSGKAILARQHEGDKSTYHYVDNLARAVRYVTRQLVDLIPKIYDTPRIARILGEDGESKMVKLDPEQPEAVTRQQNPYTGEIEKIYNPGVGRYDVKVITGPGYATKRQEALESMATLLQGNPELWGVAGDLFVKNMDWPGSQELSKRLAKTIDPKLMGEGDDNPALQKAQQQMQEMQGQLQQAMGMIKNFDKSLEKRELDLKEAEVQIKMRDSEIKAYDAETKRIQVTAAAMTPEQVQDIVRGTIDAAVQTGDLIGQIPQAPMMPQEEPMAPPMSEPPPQPPMGMPGPEEMMQ